VSILSIVSIVSIALHVDHSPLPQDLHAPVDQSHSPQPTAFPPAPPAPRWTPWTLWTPWTEHRGAGSLNPFHSREAPLVCGTPPAGRGYGLWAVGLARRTRVRSREAWLVCGRSRCRLTPWRPPALKGQHIPAQGNALGNRVPPFLRTLQGRGHRAACALRYVAPLQGAGWGGLTPYPGLGPWAGMYGPFRASIGGPVIVDQPLQPHSPQPSPPAPPAPHMDTMDPMDTMDRTPGRGLPQPPALTREAPDLRNAPGRSRLWAVGCGVGRA
jgi:hypothetical protein